MDEYKYSESNISNIFTQKTIEGGAILLCNQGNGTLSIEGADYAFCKGTVCMFLPGMTVSVRESSDDCNCMVWSFSQRVFENLNRNFSPTFYHVVVANPVFKLDTDSDDYQLILLCMEIVRLYMKKQSNHHAEMRLHNIAENIVTSVADWAVPSMQSNDFVFDRKRQLYRQFITDVCHHCKTEHYIDFYCDKLCISRRYLSQIVKECNPRYTPQMIIMEHLDFKIKRALKGTDKTITQIADEFNFQSQSNLSSFFIRNNGISPSEFRAQ